MPALTIRASTPGGALLALALFAATGALAAPATVITGAQIADGTGAALRQADVRIVGDRIAEVGRVRVRHGDVVVDGRGRVLAPGFIDIHNHSEDGLRTDPLAESQVSQGITTLVLGADGDSPWPLAPWLDERRREPAALNVGVMVGHATLRRAVMGDDFRRTATPPEAARIAALVEDGMRQGALGLSSGLEYEVGSYSDTDEVVAAATAAARHGGIYMTHVRDESDRSFESLDEELEIARRAGVGVEHSHIKLGTVAVWHRAGEVVARVEAARRAGLDVLADCYPYLAWHSNLKVMVPDRQYESPASVDKALADVGGAAHVRIVRFAAEPADEGRTLAELAAARGETPVETFIHLVRVGDAAGTEPTVVVESMTEADLETFYRQPWVMVASDGGIGARHPRGAGTFPRVLGRFVRERHWLTLVEAVRKMTSLPAHRLGLRDRGVIRPGARADLVLFDPSTVIDRSTYDDPGRLSAGIELVYVNGAPVWKDGAATGRKPGRVLPD